MKRLAILGYHKIGPPPRSGWDTWFFLPERSALITFDDGYRSMLTITLPLLQRLGLPSVLFVPTDNVGKSNSFDSGLEPDEMLCDWHDLRELHRAGVSIQSHAASHRHFSEMDL